MRNEVLSMVPSLPVPATWEIPFDRLDMRRPTVEGGNPILMIGSAGMAANLDAEATLSRKKVHRGCCVPPI